MERIHPRAAPEDPARGTSMPAVEVEGLTKSFGKITAVKDATLRIEQGEVFSLLGPNGAGKSTLISMLTGLVPPTSGEARVFGRSVQADPMGVKNDLGVVPQDIALYEDLSGRENLAFWGRMHGLHGRELAGRVDEILGVVGLANRQKDRVGTYSGGMKRRLNIAAALMHRPRVVVMDEPTVGIDPQSRRAILDHVKQLHDDGATILYTTHYMEEAQELSTRLAIMDMGEIIAEGTHDELVEMVGEHDRVELRVESVDPIPGDLFTNADGVRKATSTEDGFVLLVDESDRVLPHVFDLARQSGVRIVEAKVERPNLEAVFLHLTGRALRN